MYEVLIFQNTFTYVMNEQFVNKVHNKEIRSIPCNERASFSKVLLASKDR